jgi:regulator of sirC expression with transglutaminase-like and TPR domain
VEITERWRELMRCPEETLPLDEAALVIAAHADPTLDIAAQLRRLDQVADQVDRPDTEGVCRMLFGQLGLRGDRDTYDDPRNSYLDRVLDRRMGIPISLSVLLIETGRRCGVHLEGVGMPGHFLVRDPASPHFLIDAFAGGRRLDRSGCEDLFSAVTGRPAGLAPAMLATTGRRAILARMLANLDRSFERRADQRSLLWVTRLRLGVPDMAVGERVQLAGRLGRMGHFDEGADVLAGLAGSDPGADLSNQLRAQAVAMRARLN